MAGTDAPTHQPFSISAKKVCLISLVSPKAYLALEPDQLLSVYRAYLGRMAEVINAHGYSVRAFDPGAPSRFSELPIERRFAILEAITSTIVRAETAQKDRIPTHDNRQFAWWIIRDMKLRPTSDAFTTIEADDVIEIYDSNHLQVHRSFNFFRALSYTLDQIFTHEWWELYSRLPSITEAMIHTATRIIGSKEAMNMVNPFPDHWVTEIFSTSRNSSHIEPRIASTLLDSNGYVAAYLNVFRISEVQSGKGTTQERH